MRKEEGEADESVARRCDAAPSGLARGSAAHRSAHLSWAPMAAVQVHVHAHGQLHAAVVHPAPEAAAPGHGLLSGGPVRWGQGVEDGAGEYG